MRSLLIILGLFIGLSAQATTLKEANTYLLGVEKVFNKYKTKQAFIKAVNIANPGLAKKLNLNQKMPQASEKMPRLKVQNNVASMHWDKGTVRVTLHSVHPLIMSYNGNYYVGSSQKVTKTKDKSAYLNYFSSVAYAEESSTVTATKNDDFLEGATALYNYFQGIEEDLKNVVRYNGIGEILDYFYDYDLNPSNGKINVLTFNKDLKAKCNGSVGEFEVAGVQFKSEQKNDLGYTETTIQSKNPNKTLLLRMKEKESVKAICEQQSNCTEISNETFYDLFSAPRAEAFQKAADEREAKVDNLVQLVQELYSKSDTQCENIEPSKPSGKPKDIGDVRRSILDNPKKRHELYEEYKKEFRECIAKQSEHEEDGLFDSTISPIKKMWNLYNYEVDEKEFDKILLHNLLAKGSMRFDDYNTFGKQITENLSCWGDDVELGLHRDILVDTYLEDSAKIFVQDYNYGVLDDARPVTGDDLRYIFEDADDYADDKNLKNIEKYSTLDMKNAKLDCLERINKDDSNRTRVEELKKEIKKLVPELNENTSVDWFIDKSLSKKLSPAEVKLSIDYQDGLYAIDDLYNHLVHTFAFKLSSKIAECCANQKECRVDVGKLKIREGIKPMENKGAQ